MVSASSSTLVYNHKLSSVGPGRVTGQDSTHDPSNIDLAMKLHYIKLIHYFPSQAVTDLTIYEYKAAMFDWLEALYVPCGRLRRDGSGRAYVKCNDCGARLIEAQCGKSLDEWLEIKDDSIENLLVYEQIIGPEMNFSPLVLIQLTTFKCGGISLGLNWAHILGDPFIAAEFMSALGPSLSGLKSAYLHSHIQTHPKPKLLSSPIKSPLSIKQVAPVGDHWKITTNCKMETFSFNLSAKQIVKLSDKFSEKINLFESICAIIWKCVAKVRPEPGPKLVTICKSGTKSEKHNILGNSQAIHVVEPESSALEASLDKIGKWLGDRAVNNIASINEAVEYDRGLSDFIFYGANLTFLDFECAHLYGFEINGKKPVKASCRIEGVGEEGLVLIFPDGDGGKGVTLVMPENEVFELKQELEREFETA